MFLNKNIHEYKKLLLMNNENSIFIQRKNISYMSKKLIFIRENLLSLKKYLKVNLYTEDSIKIFKEYKLINEGVDQNFTILKKLELNFLMDTHYIKKLIIVSFIFR